MFYGKFNHSVDDKGRVIVPAKFRNGGEDKFYVTAGIERCLYVFTEPEWQIFQRKLRSLPVARESARKFVRRIFSMTAEVACDKLGRIGVSAQLLEYAGIKSDVVVAGVGDRFEIWARESWERDSGDGSFEKLAEELAELNIL